MVRPSPWIRRVRWLPGLLLAMVTAALLLARGQADAPVAAFAPATSFQAPPTIASFPGAHPHGPLAVDVPGRLADQADGVTYCASASLEPFEGALAQLRADGPGEAAERLRWCLMETVFGHTDAATEVSVRELLPRFLDCYRQVSILPAPTKQQASGQVAACVLAPTTRGAGDVAGAVAWDRRAPTPAHDAPRKHAEVPQKYGAL